MAQFINAKERLVTEALDGFLRSSGSRSLARLDGYPGVKVIVNRAHDKRKVAVVSGGGSGHEPAHAGFVGGGMLAAAVCGEVFASPSVDAVLAGILAVTGSGGCLLIVKNYTGDRLNFGLAAERARALGRNVSVVIVADDIAIPGIGQPRGIAGTLFVHKIAGFHAAKGLSLAKVAKVAREAAESIVSLGISLSSCTVPGNPPEDRIPDGKAELGLGIHGEPGAALVDFAGAKGSAALLEKHLFKHAKKAASYAILINSLGSTTPLELGVIANEMLGSVKGRKIKYVVGPGLLVTSLDMHGFSASLLPLTPAIEKALTAAVEPPAWPGARRNMAPAIVKQARIAGVRKAKASRNPALQDIAARACEVLIESEATLNGLDAKVGDGDTGSTIAAAARSVAKALPKLPQANLGQFFRSISDVLTANMGGSSGILLAILFSAAGSAAGSGASWSAALAQGLAKMMEYGGARPGDRTMVDALLPAIRTLEAGGTIEAAASAARKGADATASMTRARAGRSSYVPAEKLKGVKDPGAEAAAILLGALARG